MKHRSPTLPAHLLLAVALGFAACSALPDALPSAGVASPSPTATADVRTLAIEVARAYAEAAGFPVDPSRAPSGELAQPDYDDVMLEHVQLPVLAPEGRVALDVYVDDAGTIRVVVPGFATTRPLGPAVSADAALVAAAREFEHVGLGPSSGHLHVAKGVVGASWYITLDRDLDGYPVANHPQAWGIAGDKAWLTLRSDGTLVELYAIRPDRIPVGPLLPPHTLAARLELAVSLSSHAFGKFTPELTWVRTPDPQTALHAKDLTLNDCATSERSDGWTTVCVDAVRGIQTVNDGGAD